jgi:hypothetical protein
MAVGLLMLTALALGWWYLYVSVAYNYYTGLERGDRAIIYLRDAVRRQQAVPERPEFREIAIWLDKRPDAIPAVISSGISLQRMYLRPSYATFLDEGHDGWILSLFVAEAILSDRLEFTLVFPSVRTKVTVTTRPTPLWGSFDVDDEAIWSNRWVLLNRVRQAKLEREQIDQALPVTDVTTDSGSLPYPIGAESRSYYCAKSGKDWIIASAATK